MKVEFRESFAKDIKSVQDKGLLKRAKEMIEAIEKVDSLCVQFEKAQRWRELFSLENRRL